MSHFLHYDREIEADSFSLSDPQDSHHTQGLVLIFKRNQQAGIIPETCFQGGGTSGNLHLLDVVVHVSDLGAWKEETWSPNMELQSCYWSQSK